MPGLGMIPLAIPIVGAIVAGVVAAWAAGGKHPLRAGGEWLDPENPWAGPMLFTGGAMEGDYYADIPGPAPPPAPPAPQTREELTSPELWAATMPGRIAEEWTAWQPFEDYSLRPPTAQTTDDTLLYVALAAAAAGLLMLRR